MIFTRGLRVCLAAEPADLRRSFEGLALLVKQALKEDERSSQIFVFTNKRRDRIRLLYWDGTGLWLLSKRLEKGTFSWPRSGEAGIHKHGSGIWIPGLPLRGEVAMSPHAEDAEADVSDAIAMPADARGSIWWLIGAAALIALGLVWILLRGA
jgi:transposase